MSDLNRESVSNKTKHLFIETELETLEAFDSINFLGKSHLENDGTKNWLVFQPVHRYFKTVSANNSNVLTCKSKRLSDKNIKAPTTPNKIFNPSLDHVGSKIRVKFNGDCLKQERLTFNPAKLVNIYIVYGVEKNVNTSSYPTLENCLFGAVKLTKHIDIDLYKYFGYRIGFDRKGFLSHASWKTGKNVIIFRVETSSTTRIDNRKKDILILGKGPTQGLKPTLSAEKMYSIDFTKENTKFCLSLIYNGANSYLFVNGTGIIKFKVKDSEKTPYELCLRNISKDWSVDNTKKAGLKGCVCDFSID